MKSKTSTQGGETVKEMFFIVASNGELKKTPTTVYFPFADYDRGFSAAETRRTAKVEALDMPFDYGVFETDDPLQIEILRNYHTGCNIQTPGEWKGQLMRPHTRLLFTVTDQDPSKIGASNQ